MGNFQIPDPPLVVAGACGGPAVVYLVTPLRNALTLGSNNTQASALQLYKNVFSDGVKGGFAGGLPMARAAVPGFLVLGPAFHMFKDLVGGSSVGAVLLTAVSESMIFFGSEVNNAQATFNQNAKRMNTPQIPQLHNPLNPFGCGVGFSLHVTRNVLAMSGLRVFSSPCQTMISSISPNMSPTSTIVWGDFIANVVVSAASAPIHQLFGWAVTTQVAEPSKEPFSKSAVAFLKRQYLNEAGRISSVAGRDMFLRIAYNASIFTIYGFIERTLVSSWPESLQLWGSQKEGH
jgi:hypothetical protein